ncbi:S1C family serine protease [Acutalibacter caecimuris]|uniref:S1C family serine protease n=1 Tax=Acutalibacter caecimuris TaxID=3093657 RepID=UPI002AC8E73C|nr:trypsin-like peptidase domain-containing protein [Acutalibacter sp. M00118]
MMNEHNGAPTPEIPETPDTPETPAPPDTSAPQPPAAGIAPPEPAAPGEGETPEPGPEPGPAPLPPAGEENLAQPAPPAAPPEPLEPVLPEEEPLMPPVGEEAPANPAGAPQPPPAFPPYQPYPPYPGYQPYQPYQAAQPAQPAQPAQGYGQGAGYPGWQYPPQPAAYPPGQPYPQGNPYPQGQAYPQGQPYPYYQGYPQPPVPPRKKMSRKAKVFLWIGGVLSAIAVGLFCFYCVVAAGSSMREDPLPPFEYESPYGGDGEDNPETPSEDPSAPEEAEEEPERPQVDVTPNTEGIAIAGRPVGPQLDAEAVYDRVVPSTVTVSAALTREGQTSESTGTGIIATGDGYIITNSHVVLNSKSTIAKVTTFDGREYDAVVVGVDRTTDLAVLKTNDYGFTPAEFGDAAELSVGEWVMAIGNPGGARFSSSLTRGIISGLGREVGKYSENGMTYIQTDAAINPGNSGGPLVNMYGQVVGINSSKIITEGYEGMGFAIPVSSAQPIINELLSGGYIKGRTRLGIMCREISGSMAQLYGTPPGLQITEFNEDSGFAGSGAQEGDIIIAIDGETVESLRDVSNLLLRYEPGDQVSVTLYRPGGNLISQGEELEVTITLLEDKGETQD